MRKIEVCCTSVEDVREAFYGGAVRVELCSAISCGGVTPSHGLIAEVMSEVELLARPNPHRKLDVNVLIRPREGSFCYSEPEVRTMLEDIAFCRKAGVDGVVIGALTAEGYIDVDVCRRMFSAAAGMSTTFHRAFDACRNPEQAMAQIIDMGFSRVLTSGMKPCAMDGAEFIAKLVKQASPFLTVMPGSGINPGNIAEIERITGASEFHSTARCPVPDRNMHIVPELGFDEPEAEPADIQAQASAVRHILRTSRDVVAELTGIQNQSCEAV